MKVQEITLRALSGELSWIQVADILGVSARPVRQVCEGCVTLNPSTICENSRWPVRRDW